MNNAEAVAGPALNPFRLPACKACGSERGRCILRMTLAAEVGKMLDRARGREVVAQLGTLLALRGPVGVLHIECLRARHGRILALTLTD